MASNLQEKLEVCVVPGMDGVDRISMKAGANGETLLLSLSPSQARCLANELIAAVNRAEVKAHLKSGHSLWGASLGESRPRLARAG